MLWVVQYLNPNEMLSLPLAEHQIIHEGSVRFKILSPSLRQGIELIVLKMSELFIASITHTLWGYQNSGLLFFLHI